MGHTLESFPQLKKAEKYNLLRLSLVETERVVKRIKFIMLLDFCYRKTNVYLVIAVSCLFNNAPHFHKTISSSLILPDD